MKKIITSILLLSGYLAFGQTILTQWNFNSNPPDGNTGTGTLVPAIGTGTIATTGLSSVGAFSNGDANGGSSDPAVGDDSGYQTTGYPAQGTNEGTGGIQFDVSTVGFSAISVTFDTRHSNTSSRYLTLHYSTDGGTTWIPSNVYFTGNAGDTWFNLRTVNLSAIPELDNNALAAFRIVTVFQITATGSGAASYVASNTASSYATTGTLRYDMVTVFHSTPLPISLKSLEASTRTDNIQLDFITDSERNNDYFSIERSTDGNNFREIGKVKGAGDANTPTSYSFTDENPVRGANYYRLRQVDFDGQFTFSKVVSAQFGKTGGITVIPTTAIASVQVQLEESFSGDANWQVLDMSGRVVLEGKLEAEQSLFDIQTGHLTAGGYVLRIVAGQEVVSGQFRKQ